MPVSIAFLPDGSKQAPPTLEPFDVGVHHALPFFPSSSRINLVLPGSKQSPHQTLEPSLLSLKPSSSRLGQSFCNEHCLKSFGALLAHLTPLKEKTP
jgi:hypothetical protein